MGNAKSSSLSHDTWNRNHKKEYDATPKRYGEARGAVAVINTIGTTFGDAVMASTGMFLFSIANGISGMDAGLRKNRMTIKPKRMR